MRVMVLVKANKDSEAGVLPTAELMDEMGKFNEELAKAGILLAAEGLHPSAKGVRVRFSGVGHAVLEGPFYGAAEELVAGFWLWKVKSMAEAIQWIKRAPFGTGAVIEIRPLFEVEDFGERLAPELKEREQRLHKEIGKREEAARRKAS
jgi:hypothetical protein